MTPFEEKEIQTYQTVYTLGDVRISHIKYIRGKEGFYQVWRGEQLGYRYKVLEVIGEGTFGLVVKCLDMKECRQVAVKICVSYAGDENASNEISMFKKIKIRGGGCAGLV